MNRPYILFVSNTTGFRVGKIMRGVLLECRKAGLSLLWRESDRTDLGTLRRLPLGAIVWDKLANIESLIQKLNGHAPVVSTIGHTLDLSIPTVVPDPSGIAQQVATHLIEEGLRNFVFVGSQKNPAARLRAKAFEKELRRRLGDGFHFSFFNADFGERFWGADTDRGVAFIRLLRKEAQPLGVFAFNDQIAASCMECAEFAGLRVPQQLAIVGVDDHPIFTQMYQPLSSVKVDYAAIGRTAVSLILQMQNPRKRANVARHHFVGGELVVRQSSRPRLLGDEQISRALQHIHAHFGEHINLVDLAQLTGMSRASFAARFQRAVGQAPIRYLINLRLNQAKLFLAESAFTVSEISFRVGFEDQGYFTRAFKKQLKLTPTEYRRKNAAHGSKIHLMHSLATARPTPARNADL